MKKRCIKCREEKLLDQFVEFLATRKEGKVKQRRNTCYECNYKKHIYKKLFVWEKATKKQKLERMKERFEKYVIKKDGCWDWKGFIRPDGYTRMRCFGGLKSIGGHVVSWMIHKNKITTDGLCVLHRCDNRKCTNKAHLFLGTYRDNSVDMVNKKRHPLIKLTSKQVKKIKKLLKNGITARDISKIYNVHEGTIGDIKRGCTWRHVK